MSIILTDDLNLPDEVTEVNGKHIAQYRQFPVEGADVIVDHLKNCLSEGANLTWMSAAAIYQRRLNLWQPNDWTSIPNEVSYCWGWKHFSASDWIISGNENHSDDIYVLHMYDNDNNLTNLGSTIRDIFLSPNDPSIVNGTLDVSVLEGKLSGDEIYKLSRSDIRTGTYLTPEIIIEHDLHKALARQDGPLKDDRFSLSDYAQEIVKQSGKDEVMGVWLNRPQEFLSASPVCIDGFGHRSSVNSRFHLEKDISRLATYTS